MQKTCTQCRQGFSVEEVEKKIREVFDAGTPEQCPDCRRRNRLIFRNFFSLYHRTCDLTKKKIISMYDEGTPFPVYDMHEWWSDKWDALSFGFIVDLSSPLFPQMKRLHEQVPRMSIMNTNTENTDYCNLSFYSRNCYLVFGNVGNEDCAYGHIVWQSNDCYDCLYTYKCQHCYECIDCVQCHSLAFSRDCENCSSSQFLVHCTGCSDCFGCVGLKNKQFHIFNEAHTKEEYAKKMSQLNSGNADIIDFAKKRVAALIGKEIVKYYHGFNCEKVTGDYLYNCKNISDGYDLKNCEDCTHCATLESFTDSTDCNFSGTKSELCMNSLTVEGYKLLGCHTCLQGCTDLFYCDNCYGCKDCFGCVGLKQKRFCIFNKQYSKEEYGALLPQLIATMKKYKEWGNFFPEDFSPFAYNETIASVYFPLLEKEAVSQGYHWKEKKEDITTQQYMGPNIDVPKDLEDADDSITKSILRCESSGKLYKITPQELAFYRLMKLPLPRKCFDERQRERFLLRNPRKLFDRQCAKCKTPIRTTYASDRPETVYCEKCYLATIY